MLLRSGFIICIFFTGCASDEPSAFDNDLSSMTADYASIQAKLFTPTCAISGCHIGDNAPRGLKLDAGNAYASLFNVSSNANSSILRIAPGDPDNSYLINALEGEAAAVGRMPRNGAALPQSAIDKVREWISNGAPES